MNYQAGYTLLELLVVLLIMALLIAAVPGMALPGLDGVRFSGEVQDVVSRLSEAHEKAIESGETIILKSVDLETPGIIITLPPASPEIRFFPDGSESGAVVTLSYLGRRRSIIINSVTGLVKSP